MDEMFSPAKLAIIAIVIIGVFVLGFGMLFKTGDEAAQQSAEYGREQRQMMRQAMDMAVHAQKMQQQNMQQRMREMEMYEEGFSSEDGYNSDQNSAYDYD